MSHIDAHPALAASAASAPARRTMGAILVDTGRLNPDDVERVLRLQREKGVRFGEAAVQLRLLTPADVEFALSCQFDYPYLVRGENSISEALIAAHAPFDRKVEEMRAVRRQLLQRWSDEDCAHRALAIVSTQRKEGRSYMAANLAVVIAQLGKRTLLIDADLRNPIQHRLFNVDGSAGLSEIISGRDGLDAIKRVGSLRDFSLLPAGTIPPNPADLLARPLFARLLHDMTSQFDCVIVDTPAAAESADAQTIAGCARMALIVVLKNASRVDRVRAFSDSLANAKATVVGAVLNNV